MATRYLGRITSSATAFSTSTAKIASGEGKSMIAAASSSQWPLSTASKASLSRGGTAMVPNTNQQFCTGVPGGPKSSEKATELDFGECIIAVYCVGSAVVYTVLGVCNLAGISPC